MHFSTGRIRKVCAWCGETTGYKDGFRTEGDPGLMVTHTVCTHCRNRIEAIDDDDASVRPNCDSKVKPPGDGDPAA
jgi:hypothetical protein